VTEGVKRLAEALDAALTVKPRMIRKIASAAVRDSG
jgi:hypothetical protein